MKDNLSFRVPPLTPPSFSPFFSSLLHPKIYRVFLLCFLDKTVLLVFECYHTYGGQPSCGVDSFSSAPGGGNVVTNLKRSNISLVCRARS